MWWELVQKYKWYQNERGNPKWKMMLNEKDGRCILHSTFIEYSYLWLLEQSFHSETEMYTDIVLTKLICEYFEYSAPKVYKKHHLRIQKHIAILPLPLPYVYISSSISKIQRNLNKNLIFDNTIRNPTLEFITTGIPQNGKKQNGRHTRLLTRMQLGWCCVLFWQLADATGGRCSRAELGRLCD